MSSSFPFISALGEGLPLATLFAQDLPQAQTPTIAQAQQGSIGGAIGKAGKAVGGALGKAYDTLSGNSFLGSLFGSDYRYLTGFIGLLLIAAGIFLFRPVREIVVEGAKTAAKGAAIAA